MSTMNLILLALAFLLLLLIGLTAAHKQQKDNLFLAIVSGILFLLALLFFGGILISKGNFISRTGMDEQELILFCYSGLFFIFWILTAILFTKAVNPKMNWVLRFILGFFTALLINYVSFNFLYEMIVNS